MLRSSRRLWNQLQLINLQGAIKAPPPPNKPTLEQINELLDIFLRLYEGIFIGVIGGGWGGVENVK